ncbi:peptidase inhibitor family I36 protein [Streptomyces sp. NPDC021093]|uniref:peptidase inhibitor family I36 protein n=1 Tax=Streptomyces sp. NPDC021093 TaxID=3365112 RepID=UPI003789A0C1
MNRLRTALAGTGIALALTTLPVTAQAAEAPAVPAPSGAAADGKLHVYLDFNYVGECAAWTGNSTNWGTCRNKVSSLRNSGYPGSLDDVWVYYAPNYGGAKRGVHNGVGLDNLTKWTFDPNTGSGSGQQLNDNISSHKWTNL